MRILLKALVPSSRALTALGVGALLMPLALAQVEVIDSRPSGSSDAGQAGNGAASSSSDGEVNFQTQLFMQLQALQEEVLELRGLVEEQAHELKRLKQRRLDDYLDLDRRIGRLSEQLGGPGASGDSGLDKISSAKDQNAADADVVSETQAYRQAYQLLRDREIDQAIEAFNGYLDDYPGGNFAGNSHYWLGEIYLLQGDLDQAGTWFSRLLEEFPDDRKKPDAQYKLGRVYHQQGKETQARELLEEVAAGASDPARLARQYLKENF